MQRLLKWFIMLNKRLYKKVAFVVLLAIVPLCVGAVAFASQQQEGFIKVVLAATDNEDEIANQVITDLIGDSSLVNFSRADTPQEAVESVKNGKADAAWILPADMEQRIEAFVKSKSERSGIVTVVVRESNVFTRITQEKLTAALYSHCAKAQYIEYSRRNISQLEGLSDQELAKYFDDVDITEDLFAVKNSEGVADTTDGNYMIAPIRGLLAVAMCLCAAAATMFYMQDEKRGTFSLVKENNRIFAAFACVFIATLNMAAVVLITLLFTGLAGDLLTEVAGLLLYGACSSAFCLFIKQILRSIRLYAASIPLMVVAMLALCPIFFGVSTVGYLLPPTYYVSLLTNGSSMINMAVYGLLLGVATWLLQRIKPKKSY